MNSLFDEFRTICSHLNQVGITPTLMGSLGFEYRSNEEWQPSDIDIHVPGDPRGWEAPDHLRIYDWDRIMKVMKHLGYALIDIHEHELDVYKRQRYTMGTIIIILGLHQMEIFHFKKLEVQKSFTFKKSEANRYWSAFLLGITFSFGWTPCIGPVLSSVLALAASGGNGAWQGAIYTLSLIHIY